MIDGPVVLSPTFKVLQPIVDKLVTAGSLEPWEGAMMTFRIYCYTSARSKFRRPNLLALSHVMDNDIPPLIALWERSVKRKKNLTNGN